VEFIPVGKKKKGGGCRFFFLNVLQKGALGFLCCGGKKARGRCTVAGNKKVWRSGDRYCRGVLWCFQGKKREEMGWVVAVVLVGGGEATPLMAATKRKEKGPDHFAGSGEGGENGGSGHPDWSLRKGRGSAAYVEVWGLAGGGGFFGCDSLRHGRKKGLGRVPGGRAVGGSACGALRSK